MKDFDDLQVMLMGSGERGHADLVLFLIVVASLQDGPQVDHKREDLFWTPNSPLTCVSALTPTPRHLDYCSSALIVSDALGRTSRTKTLNQEAATRVQVVDLALSTQTSILSPPALRARSLTGLCLKDLTCNMEMFPSIAALLLKPLTDHKAFQLRIPLWSQSCEGVRPARRPVLLPGLRLSPGFFAGKGLGRRGAA
ncbi:uncharacterized protein LOC117801047 [Ailuropoda melanoleuca]|uniref:uncharacterized protein LOC117801047 n=1 Tax=Ailuropoda melanoleuca TaxID=9646 RepID=UPI001494BCC1|nr:uncharacterized protein LOC117801047 [Ailuropoda melanoleuca]